MARRYKMHHGIVTVEYARIGGYCSLPHRPTKGCDAFEIVLDSRTKGKQKLIDLLHELIHAEHPKMSEEEVTRTADNIGSAMWGEGYREKSR